MELDSHADTVVLGRNCVVMNYTNRACNVMPYTDSYEPIKDVPVVQGATGYTNPKTGQSYILVFNEALWMGDHMDHSLLNPNQLRHYGTIVQDNPYDTVQTHIANEDRTCVIPLSSFGTTLGFETFAPTDKDLLTYEHIILTSNSPWNPQEVRFPEPSQLVEAEVYALSSMTPNFSAKAQAERMVYQVQVHDTTLYEYSNTLADRLVAQVMVNDHTTDVPGQKTFRSDERHATVDANELSERWGIGLKQAKQTVKATTQRGVRSALLPLSRRYRADRMFELKRLRQDMYTDTLDGRCKSMDGNRYGQVFANKSFFAAIYPMDTKSKCGDALREFCNDYGAPRSLTFDGSREQTRPGTEFMKIIRKNDIPFRIIEPERHIQNRAEGVIRELRKKWFRAMLKKKVPRRLWDYGMRWVCDIMQRTASYSGTLEGRTPLEELTGETPDISEYLDFGFYDPVWYKENAGIGESKMGRWLGVSHRVGGLMSYWVITQTCQVVSRTTVSRVTNLEMQVDEHKKKLGELDQAIEERLGKGSSENSKLESNGQGNTSPGDWSDLAEADEDFRLEFQRVFNDKKVPEADAEFTPDVFDDTYLNMELALPRGEGNEAEFARVTKRLRDHEGRPIGTANDNPILDTRLYEVEFLDGHKSAMAANAIAENMFAQIDEEGHRHVLMDEIIDHRTNGKQVMQQDAFLTTRSGTKRRRQTTVGWEILVQWKDGSTTWNSLKDIKGAYPVQLAEYAVSMKLAGEPAFAWWVPHTLRKRNRIVAKVKSKYWQRTHKFGIRIPKTVEEARALDLENGNTLWWDAICKEMKNVRPAFEIWERNESDIPPGYQKIDCHMIFDVKMGENFRRKARFVAGGHKTKPPASITYSSVVSRDSVRIALTIAALNGLQVLSCDIQNAYLTADCREKCYTIAGPEFGSEKGAIMIVKKALYGLRSSGAAFRSLLSDTLHDMGYKPSRADPDVYLRPAVKGCGFEYYEMVLCYVDDVLAIGHDPMSTMNGIKRTFKIKNDKIEPPDMYLGAELSTMDVDGVECWVMSSEKYVKAAIQNLEEQLHKVNKRLPTKCYTPLASGYRPELDVSTELNADGLQRYQELIGILRWAVELGRVDILLETSLMSTYLASPRAGHLEQLYHMFGYLKTASRRRLAFDPAHPNIDERRFTKHDWYDFYRDAREAIPDNMPPPRGNAMSTHCFVDANHAGDKITRRSQTGILIFCNCAPIIWYSKRQNTVEASTFGSEFTAMKTAVEQIESLRYKLRMFGVPIEGSTNVFCDNEAAYKNASIPESTLKKKHHSIAYHRCREASAAGTIRVAKEDTSTNLSDLFTKIMTKPVRDSLLDRFTY